MKIHFQFLMLALCILACAATTQAITLTQPSDGATVQANGATANVSFAWDDAPVTFTVTNAAPVTINATTTTRSLVPGTYTVTIQNSANQSASATFTVTAANQTPSQPAQTITLTTDAASYEVGSSARITVAVAQPEQLSLTVTRNGGVPDAFAVTVQSQTDFLYSLSAAGTYTVTATGTGASATASFTVVNTTLGVRITGDTEGSAGRVVSFGSAVTGGQAPFTYNWQFSDNTTSSGPNADHVFEAPATYTVTLIATDNLGKTASTTRTIRIEELTHRLSVTVMGDGNRLLEDALVQVNNSRVHYTKETDSFGSVRFTNLTAGTYTLKVNYTETEITPAVRDVYTAKVTVETDRSLTVELAIPNPNAPQSNATTAAATTSTASTTSAASTPLSGAGTASTAADATQTTQESPEATEATRIAQAAAQLAADELAQARTDALAEVRSAQSALLRSETRAELLRILGMDKRFTDAESAITKATTTTQVAQALAQAPRDITILGRDSIVTERTIDDAQEDIAAYIDAVRADDDDAKRIRYAIRSTIQTPGVSLQRTVVRVSRTDGAASETYTVFTRTAPEIPEMTYVEFIPKSIARDASELKIQGSHEVLEADPIVRFLTPTYSYYVTGEPEGEPTLLLVPKTLPEQTGLLGLVAVKLNFGSLERGGWYLGIVALIIAGVLAGNVYVRRKTTSSAQSFTELAELTLGLAEQGDYARAATYLPELEVLQQALSPKEQSETADILAVLREAIRTAEFRAANDALYASFALADHVATASAYERVLSAYAALPPKVQTQFRSMFNDAHAALEGHVQRYETPSEKKLVH